MDSSWKNKKLKNLLLIFAKEGVEFVGKTGELFNPNIHEAVSEEQSSEINDGHIVQVFQKGSILKGKLLRAARVSVAKC